MCGDVSIDGPHSLAHSLARVCSHTGSEDGQIHTFEGRIPDFCFLLGGVILRAKFKIECAGFLWPLVCCL